MKKLIRPYLGEILLVLLLALMNVAGVLYAPVLTGNAIDKMLGEGSVIFDGLTRILMNLGIVIALTSLTQWLMSIVINRVAFDVVNNLRDELFYNLHSLTL